MNRAMFSRYCKPVAATAMVLMPMLLACAQNSQFLFDPSGDLAVQSVEGGGLPQIISQPHAQPLIVGPGGLSSFMVVLADNTDVSYRWQFNGGNINGATSDTLVVTNASAASEGQYWVVVANSFGSVTSAPAMLWFDGNGDGLPDSWELAYFHNLTNTATGDFDGDGVDNLQEFLDGTNPTNAASRLYRLTVESDGGSIEIVPNQLAYTNGQIVSLTAETGSQPFNLWIGNVSSRSTSISVVMTNDQTEFAHFQGAAFVWTSPSSGSWSQPTNWNVGVVPGPIDDVLIDATVTVTVTNSVECGSLTLGGGGGSPNLVCSNTLTVNSPSLWGAGTLTGPGRVAIAPGVAVTISNTPNFYLVNCTLDNAGTVTWTGPGPLELTASVITNEPGALFDCQIATTLNSLNQLSYFQNAGTFRISHSTGTVDNYLAFYNSGAVEVKAGTFLCENPFTNNGTVCICAGVTNRLYAGGSGSGSFTATAPALVEWVNGAFTLNSGGQLDGGGLYQIDSAAVLVANTDLSVSNLNFPGGTLAGSGTLTIDDVMNWNFGTMTGTGRTIISPSAALNLTSPGGVTINTRTLENAGTITWTNAGYIQLNGAVITNDSGALFDCQNAASVNYSGTNSCRIDNAGTFRKSGAGTTSFNAPIAFDNYGTLLLEAGTLWCNGPMTNYATVSLMAGATNHLNGGGAASGVFLTAPPSLLDWVGGNFTLNPGTQLSGDGLFAVNGFMTLIDNANIAPDYFNLYTGTLDGTGTLTVNTAMNWANATMQGAGRTVIGPGAVFQISGGVELYLTRTLENAGTTTVTSTGSIAMSAIITNRAGALFDFQTSEGIGYDTGSNPARIDNAGTLRKSVSSGTLTVGNPIVLDNYGTLLLQSGTIVCSGPATNNGAVTLSSGTTLQMAGGGAASGSFNTTAPSLVDWNGGTFALNPGAQLGGNGVYRTDSGSATLLDNVNLAVNNFNLFSGTLDGTGTLTVGAAMNWMGGTMQGTGRTIIASGATLTITNTGFYVVNLVTRTLENDGTATWITSSGDFGLNGAVVTNAPGALFDFHNAGTLSGSGTAADRFDNAGTLQKSSSGTTTITSLIALNNYNSLLVQTGILLCSGPYTNNGSVTLSPGSTNSIGDGGAGSGSFNTTALSLIDWTLGTFTLNPGAQLNGSGIFRMDGATLNANTDLAPNNFDIISGILGGTGTLTVNSAMNWDGGTMQGSGRTIIGPGAQMNLANPGGLTLTTRTLENAGTVTWTGVQIQMNSSVITNRAGALFDCRVGASIGYGSGTCRFDNAGTLRKSVSTLTTALSSVSLNNYNTVQLFSGILNPLSGYNSTASSVLSSRLGGTTTGTGYGQLQVGGTVALAGELSVDFTNGFVPATNNTFTVVTAGTRTGTFSSFSYPSSLVTMQLSNTASSVIVQTTGVIVPPPPLILSLALSGTNAALSWNAVSNTTYRLQYNPNLGFSNWISIPGDITSLGNNAGKLDPLTSTNHFYRVFVVP